MPTGRRSVDLAGALESCTQELGALCGGLDAQQFKDECDEDVSEQDTLASLEEMAGECAALLACFEAEENRSGELVDDEEVTNAENSNNEKNHQLPQEEEPDESGPLKAGLAHELDSFADELNEFLVCWKESNTEESATNINVYLCPSEGRSSEEEMPKNEEIVDAIDPPVTSNAATDNSVIIGEADEENLLENIVEEMSKQKWQSCTDDESKVNKEAPAASTNIPDAHLTNDEAHTANLANTTEVISERTKNAIALHVKRMELQKKQRFGAPSKLWLSQTTIEKDQQIPTEQNHSPAAIKFKPQLMPSGPICVPYPAVNADGGVTGGLKGTNKNDACIMDGEYQDLIMWEQLTDAARAALNDKKNFGKAKVPFSDEHFQDHLNKAWLY
ncbi:hypothetical protein PInf_024183 [Phytophthora infestans]|nr:hypothetical protein PInf_024183 [Phytophthora infestans]